LESARCFIASSQMTYTTRPTNSAAGMYTKIHRLRGARRRWVGAWGEEGERTADERRWWLPLRWS
jgi:hypothetical protein